MATDIKSKLKIYEAGAVCRLADLRADMEAVRAEIREVELSYRRIMKVELDPLKEIERDIRIALMGFGQGYE